MMFFRIDVRRPPSWQDRAENLPEWRRWDRQMRRRVGWRAGLNFWTKTNMRGSRVLLSRHWPHLICWSWSIWVGRWRAGYDGPLRLSLHVSRYYRHADLWLFWWYVRVSWQDYGHMACSRYEGEAPEIRWARPVTVESHA